MNKYVTNFCRDAIDHWENYQAVREYLQNWLDSDGEREFEIGGDYITLINKGIQVSNKSLMCGMSDKKNNSSKRGRFGTGSVFAMCVLTARDIDISIQNNDMIWTPVFEFCDKWKEDVLVIEEESCQPSGNFTVTITGLSAEDINNIKQTNLVFQDREVIASTEYGDIIESVDDFGEVYCGDIFVQQTNGFKYSYNIKPKYLQLNQDRSSISEWDLQSITAKLIMDTNDEDLIGDAIDANMLDTTKVQHSWVTKIPSNVSDKIGEEFVEENKGHFVTSDYTEHRENESLGNPSVYIDNEVKVKAIQESQAYADSIEDLEVVEKATPHEAMEKFEETLMGLLRDNLNSEDCAEIQSMIDSIVELSGDWSGEVILDDLPF